jgi:hypothetical protein
MELYTIIFIHTIVRKKKDGKNRFPFHSAKQCAFKRFPQFPLCAIKLPYYHIMQEFFNKKYVLALMCDENNKQPAATDGEFE